MNLNCLHHILSLLLYINPGYDIFNSNVVFQKGARGRHTDQEDFKQEFLDIMFEFVIS